MSMEAHNDRFVRCPKCFSVLLEPLSVPIYQCGGCGSRLKARKRDAPVTHPDPESSKQNIFQCSLEGSTHASKSYCSDEETIFSSDTQPSENVVEGNFGVSNSDRGKEPEGAKQADMSSSLAVMSAMDAPMSYSLGAMGPLLRKLESLLPPDYRLPKLLKDRIELLKADLEEISVALLEQSMVDYTNEMAKYWTNEVRELCYDIEDFIDNMMSTHVDAKVRSVKSYKVGRVKIAWHSKTRKPCTRAAKITELSNLVREASERHDRYLDGCTLSSKCVFTGHSRIPALHAEAGKYLVGVDDSKMKLIKLLADKEGQQLKVVAIVGPAGIGKTTLAEQVYHELGEQFECRAFVRASRKPDMIRLLGGILNQVQQHRRLSNFCTVQNLIDNLTKHLQDKRYVIVIDDLWETTAWDIVTSAFPEGNNRSRIITTTEIEGIALECCDYQSTKILKMKPLGGEDSAKLLLNLVFGTELLCPEQLKGASDIIMTKCAGLPLATIFVASILTTQPNNPDLWQHVQECLCSTLSTNSTLEETLQEILKLSYNSLPHYLKTCLMYLSVYPEGYTLWKVDLVNQWIAEGFIHTTEGIDPGKVADSYFEELVNRGMIQPLEINYNGEVLSCTLHHIVLDFIALESTEERFITALDYSETIGGHYSKARRLSLHFSNTRYATKPTDLTLSKVRSIWFFGILDCMPPVVNFKHLRILFLEFWGDLRGSTTFNLTRICRLFQLRCLKISCDASVEVELPTHMRMLQYLETLIIDAAVSAVPSDIVNLPSLLHLSLGDMADLPDEIGRLTTLRTLHCFFDLGSNSEENVLSLGNLLNLQDLHLTYCTEESNGLLKRNLAALASSLGKLVNLKSVTLAPGASGTAIYHDVWSSMSSLPVFLQRLELLPPICMFSRLPEWIGQLRKLYILKVVVSELLMEDMDILIGLPALTILSLYIRRPTAESIIFKRGAFPSLKCFKYTCGVLSLAFQEESFPNLERLDLSFNAHRGDQYDHLLSGIDYLLNLNEIVAKIGAAAGAEEPDRKAAESALKVAIRKHPRFRSYENLKRVDRVSEEYQLRKQEEDLSSTKREILQKEHKRNEGDSSNDRKRPGKETEEDTKEHSDRIPHFPATGTVISCDQMKTGIEMATEGTVLSTLPKELPLDFLRTITDQFSADRIIGTGGFGTVYLGTMPDKQKIAVKKLAENVPLPRDKLFTNELQKIMVLQHENIVKLVGYCHEEQRKVVVNNGSYIVADVFESLLCYEYLTMGSLQKNLFEGSSNMAWDTRFKIIKGICDGLCFLHSIPEGPIIHMDLKPQNILLDHNMTPKIADFGLSRLFGQEQTRANTQNVVGSYGYIAPEYLYRGEISTQSDIYSLGLLIIETTTVEKNQPNQNQPSAREFIDKVRKDWTNDYIASICSNLNANELQEVKVCIEIGLECVNIDRKKRPTIENIVDRLNGRRANRMAN